MIRICQSNNVLGKGRQGGREWLRVSGGRLGWLWWIGMVLEGWERFGLGRLRVGCEVVGLAGMD